MNILAQDFRYAIRMLRKSPGFSAVAILAIALGSAAVTTIYSVVNVVLLETSPGVGHGESLVTLQKSSQMFKGFSVMGYPLYRDLRDRSRTMEGIAAFTAERIAMGLTGSDAREAVSGLIVTGNYFDVLQVRPAAGRFFLAEEDRTPMTHAVAVISSQLWHDRFGGSPSAIGATISLQATPFTIIGVAPPEFNGTTALVRTDVYVPMMMVTAMRHDNGRLLTSRSSGWLTVIGRLRAGIGPSVAQAELVQQANAAEHENGEKGDLQIRVARLRPVPANGVGVVAIFLTVLMVVAGLVLMIASINVASMLLARGVSRRKEFVVRLSIGASRTRLVRQLLTESVVLFVFGGFAGVTLTYWITRLVARVNLNVDVPITVNLPVDGRVLVFTLAMSLVTGLVFGLVPALNASRRDLAAVLRADSAGAGVRRERARNVFVVGQLAMSVLLLVCAGLFVRAFQKGRTVNPGFSLDHVAVAPISLANAGYDSVRAPQFYQQLMQRIAMRPEVEAVSLSNMIPLSTSMRYTGIDVTGFEPSPGARHIIMPLETVGPDLFKVLRIPVLRGRSFNASDTRTSTKVAVVTQKFAVRFWPKGDAIGKTFKIEGTPRTIVGVVADGRFVQVTDEPEPFMFLCDAQEDDADRILFVRTHGDPATIFAAIAQDVKTLDPTVTPPAVQTLTDAASVGLLPQRIAASVTGVLGLVGLVLATLGLYGVIAYAVGQRTREIGIRMALGAAPMQMVKMVVGEGARLVAIGTGVGMVVAIGGSRVLARFLFGVSPMDPLTLVSVPIVLASVALLASWLPARRAAGVELANALRAD